MAKSGGGFWKGVILVIVVEAVICLIAALVVQMGGFPMGADTHAPRIEAQLGEWTHNSWVKHHAPHEADPVPVNDQTLMAGAALYQGNCAVCHGGEGYTKSPLGRGVYPGAPQFMRFMGGNNNHGEHHAHSHPRHQMSAAQQEARDDHGFYVIKHGIRFTGMPGWKYNMTDTQIWEVLNFMHNAGHLPAEVRAAWKQMPMSPIPVPEAAPAAPAKTAKSSMKK